MFPLPYVIDKSSVNLTKVKWMCLKEFLIHYIHTYINTVTRIRVVVILNLKSAEPASSGKIKI